MGFISRIFLIILCLGVASLYQQYLQFTKPLPVPILDTNEYWGPGDKDSYEEKTDLVVNRIYYSDKEINDLKKRLNQTQIHLTPPLERVGFEYGFNSKKLQQVINYWRDDYLPRWKEREIYLWRYPHYTTQIQGLQIHYIHTKVDEKPKGKIIYPVLLLHGWPGSVREFYDIIPKLALPNDKNNYIFEVVVPSLPGYGWSQGASKPGFGAAQIAVVLRNLMLRLGYKKFFIQGGDWGSLIGSNIATLFPDNVLGYHSNACFNNSRLNMLKLIFVSYFPSLFVEDEYQDFYFPQRDKMYMLLEETGYLHLQATKPDTIGAALTNNPVGLAAYILEKFSTWTNPNYRKLPDGGLGKDYSMNGLLDNVMIYYLTNSITTSMRLYSEVMSTKQMLLNLDRVPTSVPTGCARFKNDLLHSMDWQLKDKYPNLVHSTYYRNVGHFAAFQAPEILYKDFIQFVNKIIQ